LAPASPKGLLAGFRQRRGEIARAAVEERRVRMLEEPGGLDGARRLELRELLELGEARALLDAVRHEPKRPEPGSRAQARPNRVGLAVETGPNQGEDVGAGLEAVGRDARGVEVPLGLIAHDHVAQVEAENVNPARAEAAPADRGVARLGEIGDGHRVELGG
jgi:hypothetical protein